MMKIEIYDLKFYLKSTTSLTIKWKAQNWQATMKENMF